MIGKFLDEADEKQPEETKPEPFSQPENPPPAEVLNLPEDKPQEILLELPDTPLVPPALQEKSAHEPNFLQTSTDFQPESTAETIRKTGLAWSAGVVFFGSVIFMMIIGWFFDLLFGSSPWGLVGGIVLGAVIGFVQFFRISSQIFKQNS